MTSAQRLASLEPSTRAIFATNARLLSSLVTEGLVAAQYFSLQGFEANGVCVIYCQGTVPSHPDPTAILAVVPLLQVPVLKSGEYPYEVVLLDPLDMATLVFEIEDREDNAYSAQHSSLAESILNLIGLEEKAVLKVSSSPPAIWEKYAANFLKADVIADIADEFSSAVDWQEWSYKNPPPCPEFTSSSITWEQSIVEGHPTHPMYKTRCTLPPIAPMTPGSFDLYNPRVRIVALPQESLNVTYDFAKHMKPVLDQVSSNAGRPLVLPKGYLAIAVHELQIAQIASKFEEAIIYPSEFYVSALAQQSIRSLILPGALHGTSLKLGVGIKLTSAVRTISPASAYLGPRFSAHVVPVLTMDRNLVTVARELASVVHRNPDGEIAKHCSAIIREAYENTSEERGERLIVCTALVESGHRGEDGHIPAVIRVFNLDTMKKRSDWLDRFVDLFFKAFLPPVIHNGVAFECHPQNTIARFDLKTKELLGFIVRDFGGLRVHCETLQRTTGVRLDFIEGHSIVADDLEDVYVRMYHTVFHNHLQQLIRVLGLHYNGVGWEIVRKRLRENIPEGHALYKTWLSPENEYLAGKCFMRMRFAGQYRFHLHAPFPNLILYKGVGTTYS